MLTKFYMTLVLAICFCAFAPSSYASNYQLTCIDEESSFTANFLVDEKRKTIFFLNSFNPKSNQSFVVNEYVPIIDWRSDQLVLTKFDRDDKMPSVFLFNLKSKTQYMAGFYIDKKPYSTARKCFSSQQ